MNRFVRNSAHSLTATDESLETILRMILGMIPSNGRFMSIGIIPSIGLFMSIGTFMSLPACAPSSGNPSNKEDPPPNEITMRSMTFTSSEDFLKGELNGLNADTAGELQLTTGLALYETPFIWIPNSADRTVTRIDTKTLQVIGTYPLVDQSGEDCYNPSRTTVDIDGHVWVGCRGDNAYGNRDTVTPDKVPNLIDHKVVKLSRDTGKVLLSVKVGFGPRALALDVENHLWVGCSIDDSIWEIDGNSGHCYRGERADCDAPSIPIEDFPYGNAIDQRGHMWVVHNRVGIGAPDLLTEIDTASGAIVGVYGPFIRNVVGANGLKECSDLYGIAIHPLGDVWLGGQECNDVVQVKGVAGVHPVDGKHYEAGEMIGAYDTGGQQTRGVAVDLDGNVWAASSRTNTATKLNSATGEILEAFNVGQHPIGVGLDAYGNAWVVNRLGNSVHRINGLDVNERTEIMVGQGPYTYSDMLGIALRTITHRAEGFSSWKVLVDSGMGAPRWRSIHWTATTPHNTRVQVRGRCATETARLASSTWGAPMSMPGSFDCEGSNGRWTELDVRLYSAGTAASPVLYDLTVYWE